MERLSPSCLPESPGLRIGEVAKRTGLSVKTIRFYCDQGLLQPSGRSEGGYRLFNDECFAELNLIRALRVMDVPLAELARILQARRSGFCHCDSLKNSISTKIGSIDERISALESMKTELVRLLVSWQNCGGTILDD
ncbi:MAG: MerR family transcriptional regulator [Cyanobium sp.]